MKSFAAAARLRAATLVCTLSLLPLATACEVRSFTLGGPDTDAGNPRPRPDGGVRDGATIPDVLPVDAQPDDGGPARDGDACVPRPETCNGVDDDCDGRIDEGFDFFNDARNCGRCGQVCSFGNAAGVCSAGKCALGDCTMGFVDRDGLSVNGCECALSNGGVERCDEQDNDCDGKTDEDFDLVTSLVHCGGCDRACAFSHAAAVCNEGRCAMQDCEAGFVDLDGQSRNGCEYACLPSNQGVEICDGADNDCDGKIDESDPRDGKPCFPDDMMGCDVTTGACQGGCALGTFACLPGGLLCRGARLPEAELCDGKDNDCDAATDEDFDLANDPRWCGACGSSCDLPNAIEGCAAGQCTVAICNAGFVDLDGLPATGCEYACTRDGPEVCDGKDNDCDGKTDDADDDLRSPPQNFCNQTGECGKGPGASPRYPGAATYPVCTTPAGLMKPDWFCNYPVSVQLFAPNQVLGQESWCDGLDNDCDGDTDEHVNPRVGSACKDDGLGECQKTGALRCQADRELVPACDVTGVPDRPAGDESCDGKDNDCDGVTDEPWDNPADGDLATCAGSPCKGVRDDVVHVTVAGSDYYIFRYEASRPDATAAAAGSHEGRACSQPGGGRLPWTSVNHKQATAACAAAGMRLCRTVRNLPCSSADPMTDEWGLACTAGLICPDDAARPYPYGCAYQAASCNGVDAGHGEARPGGEKAACHAADVGGGFAFDLSGNVAEWTEDCRGQLTDGSGRRTYTLRGGSYANIERALRCDFTSLIVAEDYAFTDTGFRCCSSCLPGQAECNGACVSLASDRQHCGACGSACPDGTVCQNGRCR